MFESYNGHGRPASFIFELERRLALQQLIDHVIDTCLTKVPGKKIKRGLIHKLVSKQLGLCLNNKLRILVNERMISHGYTPFILHGYLYFRDVKFKT